MFINRALALCLTVGTCVAAEALLPVPPTIKADGFPGVPVELIENLTAYGESRAAMLMDWHPVRREILIGTRFGNVAQIHRVKNPGADRFQMTFFPEPVRAAAYRPGSGKDFLFLKDTGGNEFDQIYLHDLVSGRSRLLTDGKSRNGSPVWSKRGDQLAYISTRRNGKDWDVYVTNPDDPKSTRLLLQVDSPGWSVLDWSPDSRKILVRRYKSISESYLYEIDLASGARTAVVPERADTAYFGAKYAPDGTRIYLATNQDSDFVRIARLELSTKQITFVRPEIKWDVEDLAISSDGKRLAFVVNEDGTDTLHLMDPVSGKELPLPALPKGIFPGALRWHPNSRDLAFTMTSARTPADVYSINVETNQVERWTTSETGGLDASQFVEPTTIRWKSFDDLLISGFYYAPPKRFANRRPVIIDIHGGPEGQSKPGYLGQMNYYLNELGIALIRPNVRGSTGYGKDFASKDNGRKREDSVKDIGALLDWIAGRPELDASRVMVTGGSYGGYMTLASMVHFTDRLRCAVDVVGISNWVTFLERTEAYRRDLRRAEYGDERDPGMRDFLSTISPVHKASKINKPMLIVQGRNDPRVPYTESEQIVESVRKHGGNVWYLLGLDEGHGFAKKSNREYQSAATALFVSKYLLD